MTTEFKKYIFYFLVIFLLFFSCFYHFIDLESKPPGLYYDEASIAYNAFCILETGMDEHGNRYPVLFKCFGNYHEPVMIYTLVPLFKIWGISRKITRLPSAIYIILSAVIFYFLAYKYCFNKWIALLGAFSYSIIPWSFPVSRSIMSGYTPMLLGIAGGYYFIFRAFAKRSWGSALLASFFWSFAMYSHNCGRPVTAVYLILFGLSMNLILLKRKKIFCVFTGVYILIMVPLIIYVIKNPTSMTSRFNTLNVWHDNPDFPVIILRIIKRYFDYFNPLFLFIKGDPIIRHNTGKGELYCFLIPFILAGLYVAIRAFKKNPYYRFLILGLLFYPIAGILTIERMHSTRVINGSIFWCLLAVVGANFIWRQRGKIKLIVPVISIVLVYAIFEINLYMSDYFNQYQKRAAPFFNKQYVEMLLVSKEAMKKGETLYVSGFFFPEEVSADFKPEWYIMMLYTMKIPPAEYLKEGKIPYHYITPFGGRPISNNGILLTSNYQPKGRNEEGKRIVVRNHEKVPEGATELLKVPINAWRHLSIYRVKGKPTEK
jgi:hypothetical protein